MADFVIPKIWYAFLGLQGRREQLSIPYSQCSVITFHLQNITKVAVAKLFEAEFPNKDKAQHKSDISFEEYEDFLNRQLLPQISFHATAPPATTTTTATAAAAAVSPANDDGSDKSSETTENPSGEGYVSLNKVMLDSSGTTELNFSFPIIPNTPDSTPDDIVFEIDAGELDSMESKKPAPESPLPAALPPSRPSHGPQKTFSWKQLEEYCWVLYQRGVSRGSLTEKTAYYFWLLFICYAKRVESSLQDCQHKMLVQIPVRMDEEEYQHWLRLLEFNLGITSSDTSILHDKHLEFDFPAALSHLNEFMLHHCVDANMMERSMKFIYQRAVKNILLKGRLILNRETGEWASKRAKFCKLHYNRLVLGYLPTTKTQEKVKTVEKPREIFLANLKVKLLDSDKSRRRMCITNDQDVKFILEAEDGVSRDNWYKSLLNAINFKVRNPTEVLPMEQLEFKNRSLKRLFTRKQKRDEKEAFEAKFNQEIETNRKIRELLDAANEDRARWEDDYKRLAQNLNEKLSEVEEELLKKEKEYELILLENGEKETRRLALEERYQQLEMETNLTQDAIARKEEEMARILAERQQLEQDMNSMVSEKDAELKKMEKLKCEMEEALAAERASRTEEERKRKQIDELLQQETSARKLFEELTKEKESLLQGESNRRNELESRLQTEQNKINQMYREKEILREQYLNAKDEVRKRQDILTRLNISVGIPSHRGLGSAPKKDQITVLIPATKLVDLGEETA